MARDLHDILGHSLTVITVKAELAGRLLEASDPATGRAAEIADVERLAREALADVRAHRRRAYREVSAARRAGRAPGRRWPPPASRADLPSAVDDVPGRHRELFGWAVREGVTNVVRHSGATGAASSGCTADCVEISDDGRGPGRTARSGHGLAGLRERARGGRRTVVEAGGRLERRLPRCAWSPVRGR